MFKYYNKEEKLIKESIPTEIIGPRGKDSLVPNPKSISEIKFEMCNYFKVRQFILETLTPREANLFVRYYGIYDGKLRTLEKVGDEYNISRERVRQIIVKVLRKLRHQSRVEIYTHFTDAELGYKDSDRTWLMSEEDFKKTSREEDTILNQVKTDYKYSLQNLMRAYLDKKEQKKVAKRATLTKEEKEAEIVFLHILNKDVEKELKLSSEDLDKLKSCLGSERYITYEKVLNIPIEKLQEKNLQFVVDKMHALGLHFTCEAEYQEDWENLCRTGIVQVGAKKLKNKFSIRTRTYKSKVSEFDQLMVNNLRDLDLSVRAFNSLKRHGVNSIGDLVVMSENDLIRVRNLGVRALEETIEKVRSLGLDIRPDDVKPKDWIRKLSIRFASEEVEEKLTKQTETKQRKTQVDEEKFVELMTTKVENLDLSVRTDNCIKRANKSTVEDLIKMTEDQLIRVKNLGRRSMDEIVEKIKSLGLDIRPEDLPEEEWIEKLKERFPIKKSSRKNSNSKTGEVLKNFSKTSQVGERVAEELQQDSKSLLSRAMHKREERAEVKKTTLNKEKVPQHEISKMTDKQLLKAISEDLSIIKCLDDNFIVKYNKEINNIISKNKTIKKGIKTRLINWVSMRTVHSV